MNDQSALAEKERGEKEIGRHHFLSAIVKSFNASSSSKKGEIIKQIKVHIQKMISLEAFSPANVKPHIVIFFHGRKPPRPRFEFSRDRSMRARARLHVPRDADVAMR